MKTNEGRGISELNKIETEKIYDIFKKNSFSTNDYIINNKKIQITFEIGNYNSKYYKKLNNNFILITCPINYDELKIKQIITHELNNFIELSSIEDKKQKIPNYNKIKKALIEFNADNKQFEFFKHLIYKTLDNEINANVAQTYTYLRNFNTSDENILKKKLEEYSIRIEYKQLLNFNIEKFKLDIKKNNIHFNEFNNILLKNGVGYFLDFVKNKKDDDKYIDNWFKIIISNINKFLSKQDKIIYEVIEDIDNLNNYSTYQINERSLFTYEEYLKENLNNK